MSDDGPFTEEMLKQYQQSVATQLGIIKYAEEMAQVLAAAGRASAKVTPYSARFAIGRWCEVIRVRALEILAHEAGEIEEQPALERIRKLEKKAADAD